MTEQRDWGATMRSEVSRHLPAGESVAGVLTAARKAGLSAKVYWVGVGEQHLAFLGRTGMVTQEVIVVSPQDIAKVDFGAASPLSLTSSPSQQILRLHLADGTKLKFSISRGTGIAGMVGRLTSGSNFQADGMEALTRWLHGFFG